jgi:hypothetical protein
MNEALIRTLAVFPDQFAAHYALIPGSHRNWAPASWEGVPSEPLTAIEQVCHVRDIEIEGYQVRFQRTLMEMKPTLPSIDTEALARERSYATSDANAALAAFRAARAQTVALLLKLQPEQLARTAVFEGYGSVTVRSLIHFLCSHDQQHLAGLQWLLGKMQTEAIFP